MHSITIPASNLKPTDSSNEGILTSHFSPDQFLFLAKIGEGTYS